MTIVTNQPWRDWGVDIVNGGGARGEGEGREGGAGAITRHRNTITPGFYSSGSWPGEVDEEGQNTRSRRIGGWGGSEMYEMDGWM